MRRTTFGLRGGKSRGAACQESPQGKDLGGTKMNCVACDQPLAGGVCVNRDCLLSCIEQADEQDRIKAQDYFRRTVVDECVSLVSRTICGRARTDAEGEWFRSSVALRLMESLHGRRTADVLREDIERRQPERAAGRDA